MGLASRVATRIKQLFPRTSSNPRGELFGHRSDPPVRGTQDFLEAYNESPWVRGVAGRVAQVVGETEWLAGRTDRSDRRVPTNHLMLRTLRRPNALLSGTSLLRVTQLSLDLTGDAFWLLEMNGLGVPVKYWPIPPHWVTDLPRKDRPTYKISWQGWQAEIPEAQMFWAHDPSPSNPYGRGHGILQALSDEVTTDEFASKHAGSMFFNRATPEFVVMDPKAGDKEMDTHERHWNQRLRGLYRAFKPYFTNRSLEFWQPKQMDLENLTLVPLRKFERDIQLQCWGMPPEQLGIIEKSNRATIDASNFILESRLIRPRRAFLAEELTLKLAPLYDSRLEILFVDTTPTDPTQQLNVMKANPAAFTFDEWRALANLLPEEDGNLGGARIVPLNLYATTDPLDNEQRPNQPGAAANEDDADGDTDTDEPDDDDDPDDDSDDDDDDSDDTDDTDED